MIKFDMVFYSGEPLKPLWEGFGHIISEEISVTPLIIFFQQNLSSKEFVKFKCIRIY